MNLSQNIQATSGDNLIPYAWQFRAAVSGGTGYFLDNGQNLGAARSLSLAIGDVDSLVAASIHLSSGILANKVWLNGALPIGTIQLEDQFNPVFLKSVEFQVCSTNDRKVKNASNKGA